MISPRHIALALVLAAACTPTLASAQRGGGEGNRTGARPAQAAGQIRGSVVNAANGEPITSASVEVRSARDSTLVTGALTGADGAFGIDGVRPGRYYLRVSAIGHETSTRAGLAVTPAAPLVETGPIRLATRAVQMEGLTVTAERSQAALTPDRNSYTLRDLPSAAGGSTVDVLRSVPAVEVDIDGRVSLRGNENVVVQINGRPSPMRGDQLGAFLAQLPANMVDRVEVIPNPSAKYDPEGMAGIVNVVLRQNTDLGTSGGFTAGGGTTGQVNLSGNVGHQQGPLTLFGSYGFLRDRRQISGFTFRENRYLSPLTYLEQDASGALTPLSHTVNTSAELKLGQRDVLSTSILWSTRRSDREDLSRSRELDASRIQSGARARSGDDEGSSLAAEYVLAYRHTIQPRQHELSTELRFNRQDEEQRSRFAERVFLADGSQSAQLPLLENQATEDDSRSWTLQADYTRPLGERVRLETGYKGTLRRLDTDLGVSLFDYDTGAYRTDERRSNAFSYSEGVHAAYSVLASTLGRFDLQGGLRAERAEAEFDLATTGASFANDYVSLFPSALVAFNLDESRQLKASYSKRVERPRTRQLNPFVRQVDPLNVFRGNPSLMPEYTHSFEVGFQQSGSRASAQVTPFYRHTTDAVRRFTTVEESTGVATSTFLNIATTESYGADLNGSVRLGRVAGFGGFSAFRQVADASNLGSEMGSDAFGWSARGNATVRLTSRLDAQGFLMYRAPIATEQGRVSGRSMASFALRQKVLGDRGSLNLRLVDPFNTMRFRSLTDDDRLFQETERRFGSRGLFLSFTYAIGQQPRVRARDGGERTGDDEDIP